MKRKTHRADTQVDTLEVLGTVDVETLVDDTALLSRLHGASAEGVPGGLDMVGDPVVDGLVVLFGVLDGVVHLVGIVGLRGTVPCTYDTIESEAATQLATKTSLTHVDANSEAVRVDLLRSLDVDVAASSWGAGVEVRVMRSQLATEGCNEEADEFISQIICEGLTYHPCGAQPHE